MWRSTNFWTYNHHVRIYTGSTAKTACGIYLNKYLIDNLLPEEKDRERCKTCYHAIDLKYCVKWLLECVG